jgi:hypothetical protein
MEFEGTKYVSKEIHVWKGKALLFSGLRFSSSEEIRVRVSVHSVAERRKRISLCVAEQRNFVCCPRNCWEDCLVASLSRPHCLRISSPFCACRFEKPFVRRFEK